MTRLEKGNVLVLMVLVIEKIARMTSSLEGEGNSLQ